MTILFALEKWKKIILVVDDVEESVSPLFGFVGVLSLYIEHRCWFSLISCSGDKFFRFLLLSTSSPLRLFHSMERLWRRASFFLRDDPDFNLYAAENSDDLPVFSIINFEFGARPVNFKRPKFTAPPILTLDFADYVPDVKKLITEDTFIFCDNWSKLFYGCYVDFAHEVCSINKYFNDCHHL